MSRSLTIGIVVLVIVAAGLGYVFRHSIKQALMPTPATPAAVTETSPSPEASTSTATGAAQTSNVKEFTVTGSNFKFDPANITVSKGDTVKITFKDESGFHNLTVDGYNVKTQQLNTGAEQTVQFVADKAGTFNYYCNVDSHREKGMQGTLVVQ